MPRETLIGTRIRERRMRAGQRQAELARKAGISASYLNLIEHNRRRIGGKLLLDIARVLDVEPAALADGADSVLIESLRAAIGDRAAGVPELQRVEEFANRFPAWSHVLEESFQRVISLEKNLEAASDRLSHDPYLATALHDVLSSVTSIRSTAAILSETDALEPAWRDRFQRNLYDDSRRLAESSQSLVSYLDNQEETGTGIITPEDEVEAYLVAHDYTFADFEGPDLAPDKIEAEAAKMRSAAARYTVGRFLTRHHRDAMVLPTECLVVAVQEHGLDPLRLALHFSVDVAVVMRRLASLNDSRIQTSVGLVICDASGALTYRKPVSGFAIPRFGAGCPVWPLFRALSAPHQVLQAQVGQVGSASSAYLTYAVAVPVAPATYNQPPILESHMLICPVAVSARVSEQTQVGVSCRICAAVGCFVRREPSILAEGL